MHYGAPPSKKQKLGPTGPTGLTGLAGLAGLMDPYEAFRVLGASHTARSTDPFPERSAKVRYETLTQEHKDDPGKLEYVERRTPQSTGPTRRVRYAWSVARPK